MWRLAPYLFGALISAFAAGYWTGNEPHSAQATGFANRWLHTLAQSSSTRGKQDRLAITHRARQSDSVQTIETTGNDYATVVYRDKKGVIVFRNDPDAGKTVAMKNVVFPAVPAGGTAIDVAPPPPAVPHKAPVQKLMEGCEPALSPLASREAAAFGGRCLAVLVTATRVASAL